MYHPKFTKNQYNNRMKFFIKIKLNDGIIMQSINIPDDNILFNEYFKFNVPMNNYNQYKKLLENKMNNITYFFPKYFANTLTFQKYLNYNFPYYFISGSELLWPWQLGYLNNMSKKIENKIYFAICVSGGSLANCLNLCDVNIENIIYDIHILLREKHNYTLDKKILNLLDQLLHYRLPEDAHVRCNGRMGILIKKMNSESILIDYFESKTFLIKTIIVACSIPFLTCDYNGKDFINGKYCDNLICNNPYNFIKLNPNYDLRMPMRLYYYPNNVNKIMKLYNLGQSYVINNNTYFLLIIIFLRMTLKLILLFFRMILNAIKDFLGY